MRKPSAPLRRLAALALGAGTLWAAAATAGSATAAEALEDLRSALPLSALKWELGDLWADDTLTPAVALTIRQSPLLLAARPAMAELWAKEPETAPVPPPPEAEEELITVPLAETPLDADAVTDNGVRAKTLVPTDPSGYTICGSSYISNSTDYALSISDLQQPFAAELSAEEPQILILHTHGSESYTPAGEADIVWSGHYRTTDSRYNVVKAGDVMSDVFAEAGISVLHDRTLYDYPSYTGSYDRSLAAIQSYLAQYPSIQFILDVHRDAVEDAEGNEYKVVSQIGEETSAQLTLVVGSDGSGLEHPHWMENLRLAVAVQEEALTRHPTLMRPILLRNSRYNQHAAYGSLLVEVGAAGNAPEEAALAARLFAESMVEVLQARSK